MVHIVEKTRLIKSTGNYETYLYLQKSYRDITGKVRTKHMGYIGLAKNINENQRQAILEKYNKRKK